MQGDDGDGTKAQQTVAAKTDRQRGDRMDASVDSQDFDVAFCHTENIRECRRV